MENISIEIYNLVGKLISENNYNLNIGSNRINLILDNLFFNKMVLSFTPDS